MVSKKKVETQMEITTTDRDLLHRLLFWATLVEFNFCWIICGKVCARNVHNYSPFYQFLTMISQFSV